MTNFHIHNMKHKTQKGSILIYSVLILGVILSTTLALGNILLPRLKTAGNAINSAVAEYAADSALEWCLYTQRGKLPATGQPVMANGATFAVYFPGSANTVATCDSAEIPLNHRVVGTYRGVSRSFIVQEY